MPFHLLLWKCSLLAKTPLLPCSRPHSTAYDSFVLFPQLSPDWGSAFLPRTGCRLVWSHSDWLKTLFAWPFSPPFLHVSLKLQRPYAFSWEYRLMADSYIVRFLFHQPGRWHVWGKSDGPPMLRLHFSKATQPISLPQRLRLIWEPGRVGGTAVSH